MRIKSIHLTNYRCHKDLHVEFRPGFNVLVGVNGSGKTSLLIAIAEALSGPMTTVLGSQPPMDKSREIARIERVSSGGRLRFEAQSPVAIDMLAEMSGKAFEWKTKRAAVSYVWLGEIPIWNLAAIDIENSNTSSTKPLEQPAPLVAFYQSNRNWSSPHPTAASAAETRNSRKDGYANWWDASTGPSALQTWVIAKCLERFQTSSETGVLFEDIQDDELALANSALAASVEGIKGLYYDMKQKALVVEWQPENGAERDPTLFENLSDGQRAVIALVADIARRMCLLNPHLGNDVTTQTPGVVLIDELDMHLHPKWQRILTKGLKAAFPAIQFIVASHSPQVLGELRPDEIILLRPEGTAHPQVSYGLDSSQVLEEIMGATARTSEVEDSLSELFASIERNEIGAARERLKKLKEEAPGIAELGGAEALIKRKELLGR